MPTTEVAASANTTKTINQLISKRIRSLRTLPPPRPRISSAPAGRRKPQGAALSYPGSVYADAACGKALGESRALSWRTGFGFLAASGKQRAVSLRQAVRKDLKR